MGMCGQDLAICVQALIICVFEWLYNVRWDAFVYNSGVGGTVSNIL